MTRQLETKYLANLTGNEVYEQKAEHFMKVVEDQRMPDDPLLIYAHPDRGSFHSKQIHLGSRSDPYYGIFFHFVAL